MTAVLLVHGAVGHSGWLQPWASALQERGIPCNAVDLAGHGDAAGTPSVEAWTEDIIRSAASMQAQHGKVRVASTGWSCVPAFHALQARPDLFSGAFLHACVLPEVQRRFRVLRGVRIPKVPGALPSSVLQPWNRLTVDMTLQRKLREDPRAVTSYAWDVVHGFLSARAAIPPAGNTLPVTLCVGERDRLFPAQQVLRTFMGMGGPKRMVVLPDVGHALWAEAPELLADAVVASTR